MQLDNISVTKIRMIMILSPIDKLTDVQRQAWKQYYHMHDLCEYSYRTQMIAFADFCSDNNINL